MQRDSCPRRAMSHPSRTISRRRNAMKRPPWFLVLSLLLLGSAHRVQAGKQRTEVPMPAPTARPGPFPTRLPTLTLTTSGPTYESTRSPTGQPSFGPTTNHPTAIMSPTTTIPSPTTKPILEDSQDDEENLYTLEIPEMRVAFTMPSETQLNPNTFMEDLQSFFTTVMQVTVGVQVQEWTDWDTDVTYTTVSGNGVAVVEGQVAVALTGRRLVQVSQETLESELYDYFFVWGVDEMWKYFVARGYPITSLNLQFSDLVFSPRRSPPEDLQSLVTQDAQGEDRNKWIAGVVMAVVVVVVVAVVALLYLQRRGRQTQKASDAASPRTLAVSDNAPSPNADPDNQLNGSFDRDMDLMVRNSMIVTGAPSDDVSSVPGFSESSFLYDASRLDQVIDSARVYELPYAVPNNTFSDLTTDIKDITLNDEEDIEDDIILVQPEKKSPENHPFFRATLHDDIDDQDAMEKEKSLRAKAYQDIQYSPSLFDDEKKDTESKN